MDDQRGQSTLEYVALVLLTLGLLALGGATLAATGIAQSVRDQLARAICIAGAGDCERDRLPCLVASRTTATDFGVRLAIVRIGGGRTLVRERRSDGSELISILERGGLGLEASVGGELSIRGSTIGASFGALVEGRLGHGRAWRVAGPREADALLARLAAHVVVPGGHSGSILGRDVRPLPEPDVVFGEHGLDVQARARLGALGISLETEDVIGSRADRSSGERTLAIRRRNDLLATISIGVGTSVEGLVRSEQRYALTLAADGRPLDLALIQSGRVQGNVVLPGPLRALLGDHLPALRRGRVVQLERHLDLTEAANLTAAGAYVRALREPHLQRGDAVAISAALGARMDVAGSAQARVYALTARHRGGHGSLSVGAGFGGRAEQSEESLRLVGALAHAPGGGWRERGDCLGAATEL